METIPIAGCPCGHVVHYSNADGVCATCRRACALMSGPDGGKPSQQSVTKHKIDGMDALVDAVRDLMAAVNGLQRDNDGSLRVTTTAPDDRFALVARDLERRMNYVVSMADKNGDPGASTMRVVLTTVLDALKAGLP